MRAISVATRGVVSNRCGIALASRGIIDTAGEEAVPSLLFGLAGRFDVTNQWINQRISEIGPLIRAFAASDYVDEYWTRITDRVGERTNLAMPKRFDIIDLQDKIIKLSDDLRDKE